MSRNFSHPRGGNFCVQIMQLEKEKSIYQYNLFNFDTNQVQHQGLHQNNETERQILIDFGHLEAGNYHLTLRNISSRGLTSVELCPGMVRFLKTMCFFMNANKIFFHQVKDLIR
jgi:hypothetical protein